ncbi:MAG: lysophospholipid acyltransferase family protein [Candidatus Hodarchaeales archaeon]|jgi:1-acyl-sn-glycerol-3-phosphate acyltransferase
MPDDLTYDLIRKSLTFASKLGYRMDVKGKDNLIDNKDLLREGAIFAGNHESVIDAFLMGLIVPPDLSRVYFLGKHSALWRNRFWGRMMDYFGVIPVQDHRRKIKGQKKGSNKEAIRKGMEVLQKKQALGIFPEGHIRYSRKSLEGKVGVARFSFETDCPVIPVGIIGTDGILPYGGNWPSAGKRVTIAVGEPLFFDKYGKDDIYEISALRDATSIIMNRIRILSAGYGIDPRHAQFLSCMQGINPVLVPKYRLRKKSVRVKKNAVTRFDDWLVGFDDSTRKKKIIKEKDTPPSPDTGEKFIEWLDNQL